MTHPGIAAAAYGNGRRTQSPLRIVVELFDTALTRVAHAKAERKTGNREKEFEALSAAVHVLCGLDACLDRTHPQAQPVVHTLHTYYQRTIVQLHAAMRAPGGDGIERYGSVHRQILCMREVWAGLAGSPSLRAAPGHELPGRRCNAPTTKRMISPSIDREMQAYVDGSGGSKAHSSQEIQFKIADRRSSRHQNRSTNRDPQSEILT